MTELRNANKFVARLLVGILFFQSWAQVIASVIPESPLPLVPTNAKPAEVIGTIVEQPSNATTYDFQALKSAKAPAFSTSLSEVGRPVAKATEAQLDQLRTLAKDTTPSRTERARAQVQLGEALLGVSEPAEAEAAFLVAAKVAIQDSVEQGIARYNLAIAQFFQGKYRDSASSFDAVLNSAAKGFSRKTASMFAEHAKACAGYHEVRGKAGITQPYHIDPLGGVAAVAQVNRFLQRSHKEEELKSLVPHSGEGSSIADIANAAPNLGLTAHQLVLNDDTLKAYFKISKGHPLIALVQRNHIAAIAGADDEGVRYFCSDCGEWPGGEKFVTWEQWRMMEAHGFLALVPSGSDLDRAVTMLALPNLPVKELRSLSPTGVQIHYFAVFRELTIAGISRTALPMYWRPGTRPEGLQCICRVCPEDGMGGFSLNLANRQAEAMPVAGMKSSNPSGPSVNFAPHYYSKSSVRSELGDGWSHPYNVGMSATITESGGVTSVTGHLIEKNGGRIGFTYDGTAVPSSTVPSVECDVTEAGYPIKVYWVWDAVEESDRFEFVFKNRNKWVSDHGEGTVYDHQPGHPVNRAPTANTRYYRPIKSMYDRLENGIHLEHVAKPGLYSNYGDQPCLTAIKDDSNATLMTFNLDSNGYLISTVDSHGRKVLYELENINLVNPGTNDPTAHRVLTGVSQVVAASATTAPLAVEYGYETYKNGALVGGNPQEVPYLETMTTPSPTGTGSAITTYVYDDTGAAAEVTGITDPNGNKKLFVPGGTNEVYVETRNSSNTLVEKYGVQYDGNMQAQAYLDANADPVRNLYYAAGNFEVTSIVDANARTWEMAYDSNRNLIWSKTPKETTTKYTYSNTNWWGGELVEVQMGTGTYSSFTPTRAKTTYEYYQPSGLLERVTSPAAESSGVSASTTETTYTYDSLGNILTIVSPGNNAESTHTTTFNYTTDGTYSQTARLGQPLTVQNSMGEKTHFRYDSRGNMISSWDHLGNQSDFEYNLADQQTKVELPATGSTGVGRATTLTTYMWVGGPASQTNHYSEAGGSAVRTTSFAYGQAGELLSRTGATEDVTMTYDAAYKTKTVTDGVGSGHTTTYTYNTKGQVTQIDYPEATGTNFDRVKFTSYDDVGNLLTRVDGRGLTTTYTYAEGDGRLSEINYTGASSEDVEITYDAYGRVTAVESGSTLEETEYFESDLVSQRMTEYTGATGNFALIYGYHPDGSRSTLTTEADVIYYRYDKAGRCVELESQLGIAEFEYLGNGWMENRILPNGSATNYSYNAVGMLTSVSNTDSVSTEHSLFDAMTYDGVFNLVSHDSYVNNVTDMNGATTYTYDSKDRLTQEVSTRYGGYTESQVYDGAGNPTTFRSAASIVYNNSNQRTGTGFAFDGNGNPTTWRGKNATFDRENRMTAYGSTMTAGYRPDGLRAWRQYPGEDKKFFLYDNGNVVCEIGPNGGVTASNIFAPDGLVGRQEFDGETTTNMEYLFDHQGNVVSVLNSAEESTIHFAYNAWGSRNYAHPEDGEKLAQPFSYNGKWGYYLDYNAGLYYCQNRYYDPEAGRWLTRDPIGFEGGVNVYGYCASSPVGSMDPSGLLYVRLPSWLGGDLDFTPRGFTDAACVCVAAMASSLADLVSSSVNATSPVGLLLPVVTGNDYVPSWDGGQFASSPGFNESRTSWEVAGAAASLAGGGAGFVRGGGRASATFRDSEVVLTYPYANTGGGGIRYNKCGRQVGRFDIHLEPGRPWYQGVHLHRRGPGGIARPWPWK